MHRAQSPSRLLWFQPVPECVGQDTGRLCFNSTHNPTEVVFGHVACGSLQEKGEVHRHGGFLVFVTTCGLAVGQRSPVHLLAGRSGNLERIFAGSLSVEAYFMVGSTIPANRITLHDFSSLITDITLHYMYTTFTTLHYICIHNLPNFTKFYQHLPKITILPNLQNFYQFFYQNFAKIYQI